MRPPPRYGRTSGGTRSWCSATSICPPMRMSRRCESSMSRTTTRCGGIVTSGIGWCTSSISRKQGAPRHGTWAAPGATRRSTSSRLPIRWCPMLAGARCGPTCRRPMTGYPSRSKASGVGQRRVQRLPGRWNVRPAAVDPDNRTPGGAHSSSHRPQGAVPQFVRHPAHRHRTHRGSRRSCRFSSRTPPRPTTPSASVGSQAISSSGIIWPPGTSLSTITEARAPTARSSGLAPDRLRKSLPPPQSAPV